MLENSASSAQLWKVRRRLKPRIHPSDPSSQTTHEVARRTLDTCPFFVFRAPSPSSKALSRLGSFAHTLLMRTASSCHASSGSTSYAPAVSNPSPDRNPHASSHALIKTRRHQAGLPCRKTSNTLFTRPRRATSSPQSRPSAMLGVKAMTTRKSMPT